jgi:hypothetical protein
MEGLGWRQRGRGLGGYGSLINFVSLHDVGRQGHQTHVWSRDKPWLYDERQERACWRKGGQDQDLVVSLE